MSRNNTKQQLSPEKKLKQQRQQQEMQEAYRKAVQERPWEIGVFVEVGNDLLPEEEQKMTEEVREDVAEWLLDEFPIGSVRPDFDDDYMNPDKASYMIRPDTLVKDLMEIEFEGGCYCQYTGLRCYSYEDLLSEKMTHNLYVLYQRVADRIMEEYPEETTAYIDAEKIRRPYYNLQDLCGDIDLYENMSQLYTEVFPDCWDGDLFCKDWTMDQLSQWLSKNEQAYGMAGEIPDVFIPKPAEIPLKLADKVKTIFFTQPAKVLTTKKLHELLTADQQIFQEWTSWIQIDISVKVFSNLNQPSLWQEILGTDKTLEAIKDYAEHPEHILYKLYPNPKRDGIYLDYLNALAQAMNVPFNPSFCPLTFGDLFQFGLFDDVSKSDFEEVLRQFAKKSPVTKLAGDYLLSLSGIRRLEEDLPALYQDLFPQARAMKRKWILHIGPTNSGKTYQALQDLKQARNGVYLGPLRLLAYEKYEELRTAGIPASLITGEEEILEPYATVICSTCEMADFHQRYDVAVIDEAQMLADEDRGGAWTAALFGLQAETLHVCASVEAKPILLKIAGMCEDSIEVMEHSRFTPLLVSPDSSYEILQGDARIVFSRKAVHGLALSLKNKGYKVSMIYGAMPYTVRQKEAEKFRTGQTEVVVSTDAIGLGINLPIHRIVFEETYKFDGKKHRRLKDDEYRQIAGRAGRFGIYPEGYFSGAHNKRVRKLLQDPASHGEYIQKAVVGFPPVLPTRAFLPSEILKFWQSLTQESWIVQQNLSDQISRAKYAETITSPENAWMLCAMAFDNKEHSLFEHWKNMCEAVSINQDLPLPHEILQANNPAAMLELTDMESAFRLMDLYYQFYKKFGTEDQLHDILDRKNQLANRIMDYLEIQGPEQKRCKFCKRPLDWDYPHGMCQKCHDEIYGSYDDDLDENAGVDDEYEPDW